MPRTESRAVVWIRRVLFALIIAQLTLAAWGMYRRIWQILRIDLHVPSATLSPGTTVSYDVITSGETQNRIRLELVQEAHAEVLLEQRAAVNAVNTWDPRIFRYTPTITMSRDLLSRFQPGHATLRLTAFGGQKLLRTPAPRVREVAVRLTR